MARQAVTLEKRKAKLKSGKAEYWYMRWYSSEGKYCSKSIGRTDKLSKRQARKIAHAKQLEFETATVRRDKTKNYRLSEYVEHYFKVREHELALKTVQLHRQAARYLVEYCGKDKRLQSITRANARAFQAAMAANKITPKGHYKTTVGATTVYMYMKALRKMFGMALEDHLITENPFSKIITMADTESRWHYVTHEEYARMMNSAPYRFKLLISLCRLAGLRKAEAINLEWADIDFETNRLYVTAKDHWKPKTRKSLRTIPICPELQSVLLEAYGAAQDGQEHIVFGDMTNIDRDIKIIRRKAKVEQYGKPLHTLRKSCITDWAKKFPMHVAQYWAGHTNITTTAKYYSQVREDDFKMAAEMRHFEQVYTQNDTQSGNGGAGYVGNKNDKPLTDKGLSKKAT